VWTNITLRHNKINNEVYKVCSVTNPHGEYTWWWLIVAETGSVYIGSEENKNIIIVARKTEFNYLYRKSRMKQDA
jgi:hypothetical protein